MNETAITVTEAARHFADCVNPAHFQHRTFILLKNGRPFARIEPAGEKRCTAKDLSEALAQAGVSTEEAGDWNRDLVAPLETLTPPAGKRR